MPDNHTNLPILDDIIKPGDTGKAVHQPSSKVQSSLWSDEQRNGTSAAGNHTGTGADPAGDDSPDTTGLFTDDQSASDTHNRNEILENAEETRTPAINLPDLDALTEEILGNMMLELEQRLRVRIRQTLSRYFASETGAD